MAIDTTSPRSRRALLAAVGGGLAALAAQAIGRPLSARGANFDAVTAGTTTTSSLPTKLLSSTGLHAFWAESTGGGMGLLGSGLIGTRGYSDTAGGTGVNGQLDSTDGKAVHGYATASSGTTYGVYGRSSSTAGYGVSGLASATSGTTYGVYGRSNSSGGSGVYGYNYSPTGFGMGVQARTESTRGSAVWGFAASSSGDSSGVWGEAASPDGHGVHGKALSGVGGYFYATSGIALQADGRVLFKTAGLATVGAGNKSVMVNPGVEIDANTKILATLQGNAGAGVTVERILRDTAANNFTIRLTANASSAVKVAWFLLS